jgi:hypothetical protein
VSYGTEATGSLSSGMRLSVDSCARTHDSLHPLIIAPRRQHQDMVLESFLAAEMETRECNDLFRIGFPTARHLCLYFAGHCTTNDLQPTDGRCDPEVSAQCFLVRTVVRIDVSLTSNNKN